MTEVFVNRRSGKIANRKPGYGLGGGVDETEYRRANFAENLAVITCLVDLVSAVEPEAKIFMTVSPVPLKRTFSGEDIFVANAISRSTMRAVLAEIGAMRSKGVYFPSYDAVMAKREAAFEEDGRHVRRDPVTEIPQSFVIS